MSPPIRLTRSTVLHLWVAEGDLIACSNLVGVLTIEFLASRPHALGVPFVENPFSHQDLDQCVHARESRDASGDELGERFLWISVLCHAAQGTADSSGCTRRPGASFAIG